MALASDEDCPSEDAAPDPGGRPITPPRPLSLAAPCTCVILLCEMGADATVEERKRALRTEVRGRLRALGPLDASRQEETQRRLLASGLLDATRCIAMYRSLSSEPATSLLEATLVERGVVVCHPVVDEHGRVLTFRAVHPIYRRGKLGIEEPHPDAEAIALSRIERFVLPALACDARGNRLGRGRGHYDATLAARPEALRICLLRDATLVAEVPSCEHDAPPDALCTESSLILCSTRAQAMASLSGAPEGKART